MDRWEDLVTVALLGTDRRPIAERACRTGASTRSTRCSGAAARHRAAVRAGRLLESCPPPERPPGPALVPAPPPAQDQIAEHLAAADVAQANAWLGHAAEQGLGLAAEHWVAAAALAARAPRVDRRALAAVLGPPGVWFVSRNPEWASAGRRSAHRPERAFRMSQIASDQRSEPLRPTRRAGVRGELAALQAADDRPRPPQWRLSPWAVVTYLVGGQLPDGTVISGKYVGSRRLVEVAVATLATDRALLLLGVPGTAKSWMSEHLAAAISGDSTLMVQGTAGTAEEAIRYGWNYARLLAEGPSAKALVPSPVMNAMRRGAIARIEELTRIPADVQDGLITILSEKTLPIPELGLETQAVKGFNVIATANDRDRGVNELSSALRRRFNTVVLPLPASEEDEVRIVSSRVAELASALELPEVPAAIEEIRRVVTVFRELRSGLTNDGRTTLKSPTGTLSAAEAISVITSGLALSAHFGDGRLRPADVAASLVGAVVKDPVADRVAWTEYLEVAVREREGWAEFYSACQEVL